MKYCKITTENHPIAKQYSDCVEALNSIFTNEGFIGECVLFEQEQTGINLDSVEISISSSEGRNKEMSVDVVLGVKTPETDERYMVLTELKLRQTKANRNPSITDIDGKIAGSLATLGNSVTVTDRYYMLFSDDVVEQAKNRFIRSNSGIYKNYIASTVKEWHDLFFA